jgi:hypothetical protein
MSTEVSEVHAVSIIKAMRLIAVMMEAACTSSIFNQEHDSTSQKILRFISTAFSSTSAIFRHGNHCL